MDIANAEVPEIINNDLSHGRQCSVLRCHRRGAPPYRRYYTHTGYRGDRVAPRCPRDRPVHRGPARVPYGRGQLRSLPDGRECLWGVS